VKILGVSNPSFQGVSIATQAISTAYYGVSHITNALIAKEAAKTILNYSPDILIIGGWSEGYELLLGELRGKRNFPIICIYHGTLSHSYFDEVYMQKIHASLEKKDYDLLGFVHPKTAEYYQTVRYNNRALWIPHYFEPKKKVSRGDKLRIGIFGGTKNWYKNCSGAIQVARDYAAQNPYVEVITNQAYTKTHEEFLKDLGNFQLLIHPSFLECYSNTVQEAWARGIPVILSTANAGLYNSPLMGHSFKHKPLILEDAIDPLALRWAIGLVDGNWEKLSKETHEMGAELYHKASDYTGKLLIKTLNAYKTGAIDKVFEP